ncbi:DUF6850 family outer membrane beta-barrel protein [Chryseobacterium indoltheticum]|uniref:DUF6850 family outer membrane beta-barrel protein n=1 Tax=Chryseobacterium indoltheticum TaxID=254 RepID=UPI003F49474A
MHKLGYRSRDPRLKSTTSDLSLNAGVNYKVFREYEVGIFGTFNKYTQNSSLTFQSVLGKPFVYQMVGLGISNYFSAAVLILLKLSKNLVTKEEFS